jgi:ribosome biogenesis GTPase A
MKGGSADTERGAAVVLDEFRAGKLGRITLEPCRQEKAAIFTEAPKAKERTEDVKAEPPEGTDEN